MREIKPSSNISSRKFTLQRLFSVFIIVTLLICLASAHVNAAWDGTGSSGGSGGTGAVTNNDFVLSKVGIEDATGYRFSIYNGNGDKVGHSIDIMFEDPAHTYYRSYKDSKQSHIDLYRTYKSSGDASLGTLSTSDSETGYVYYDDTIPALDSPPTIGSWLTKTKASNIAKKCGAYTFGTNSTHYIVVEPVFVAKLDGRWHALTMAEYAVYQANQAGSWTKVSIPEGGYMYNIGRFTSAVWGRYLYATGNYSVLGTSSVVESEHLTTDKNGTKTVLLPNAYNSRNTAANILKYQVGMAVYTDVVPSYKLDISGVFDGVKQSNISGLGTCDVYINGSRVANDVTDYNQYHPQGTLYEIKDIKSATGKSYSGSSESLSGTISGNTEVTLEFTSNTAKIRYHANGGSISSDTYSLSNNLVYKNGSLATVSWYYGKTPLNLHNDTTIGLYRTGYHIKGTEAWRLNSTTGKVVTQGETTDATMLGYFDALTKGSTNVTITMYANWQPNTYTVKYDGNSSTSGTTANSIHTYGVAKPLTKNGFEKDGYTFTGWNTAPDGTGTSYPDQQSVKNLTTTNNDTVKLYAQWTPDTYTIKHNANGGAGSMEDITIIQGDAIQIKDSSFTRDGHTFTGWNTAPDGTGTILNPGDNYTPSGDITLYAIWVPEEEATSSSPTGFLRFIQLHHLETLNEKSKWRAATLLERLTNALSDDLSDATNFEQVWYFPAEGDPEKGYKGYDDVKDWCQEQKKGTQTNKDFLEEFKDNKIQ